MKNPVYLAKEGLRFRRAVDSARMLPVFAVFLIFLPVLWAGGSTRNGAVYIFAVWFGLILIAGFSARRLRNVETTTEPDDKKEPDNGSV